MPRSPASQLPGGRLCSTSVRRLRSRRCLISSAVLPYGNRNSTASKPAFAARSKRSRKATSVKSIERLAAKRGITFSWFPGRLSVEHRNGGRNVRLAGGELLEFHHVVDLGAHCDIGHALENDLDHHRHLILRHPGLGLLDGRRDLFLLVHADRLASESFDHLDVIDAVAAHDLLLGRI